MTWQFIVVLALAVPVILFPIALIWFLDVDGILRLVRKARKRKELSQNSVDGLITVERQIEN